MMKLLYEDRPMRDHVVLAVLTIALLFAFWRSVPTQFQGNQNFDYICCYETAARDWIDGKGLRLSEREFRGPRIRRGSRSFSPANSSSRR